MANEILSRRLLNSLERNDLIIMKPWKENYPGPSGNLPYTYLSLTGVLSVLAQKKPLDLVQCLHFRQRAVRVRLEKEKSE